MSIQEVSQRIPGNVDTELARMIDHTLLRADATKSDIQRLCEEALAYRFASVCVNPVFVDSCFKALADSTVKVCTVIGFPLGATTSGSKIFEARSAMDQGATELDVVMNIGWLRSGDYRDVRNEIESIVQTARGNGALVKIILETSLLSEEEKWIACVLAKEGGADFVKTSTGFADGVATVEDIRLMRRAVGSVVGVKASGGIRNRAQAWALVEAGANRIGTSASVTIISGKEPDGRTS